MNYHLIIRYGHAEFSKLHIALLDLLQTNKQYCVNTVDHSVSGNKWLL